jgi:hypothetical protein
MDYCSEDPTPKNLSLSDRVWESIHRQQPTQYHRKKQARQQQPTHTRIKQTENKQVLARMPIVNHKMIFCNPNENETLGVLSKVLSKMLSNRDLILDKNNIQLDEMD